MVSKLFALFKLFLSSLDIYVWEPLFWVLTLLFLSGLEEISNVRKGNFYTTSKKQKLISAATMIIISILTFWYYWLRPVGIDKLISM